MLLNSTQGIARSQHEEESSVVATQDGRGVFVVATQDRGTEQEYCSFDRRSWKIDPRIETAIGSAQVLRRPQHEAQGGSYHRIRK